MSEKDFAPLSAACVRALNDKIYDKRKAAALEIEKMVKDFEAVNNTVQIKKLLHVLGQDFTLSHNANSRKGGLIGLAAMAIALGKDTSFYIDELVCPVMSCFSDQDSRVRYYACEALYNVVKVARGSFLPFFNDVFDALSKLVADPDQNVKNGCELLDRLLKDIVTESSSFDLVAFMPLLRERIYTRNPFARQFIVSWISVLDAVPDIDMLIFLPEILDGLFQILGDPTMEIRKMCENALGEFLRNIIKNPQKADFPAMMNILIVHSQSTEELVQFTAITWMKEFVNLAGRILLPYASGILTAVLPSLAYEDNNRRNVRETAKAVNYNLMQLVTSEDDRDKSETKERDQSNESDETKEDMPSVNEDDQQVSKMKDTNDIQLDLSPVVEVLTRTLNHMSTPTKLAVLRWIYHLHIKIPNKIFCHVETIFPKLLQALSDLSDEVVLLDLEVLAEISSSAAGLKDDDGLNSVSVPSPVKDIVKESPNMNSYFTKFMVSLLNIFSTNNSLLEERGSFIIRQLCLLLNAEDIYRTLSEILQCHNDLRFACHMVQTLNSILLTSTELFELRIQLKELKTEKSWSLFCCLYRSWCHSPVATVSLCFLTQNYKHASQLLQLFGDLEVTVDFLTEIDKLIQLIESPIFTYLRLQLLDPQQNTYLVKSLYGLLMLLPQSDAFHLLRRRLSCVPDLQLMPPQDRDTNNLDNRVAPFEVNFVELLQHFQEVQIKHRQIQHSSRFTEHACR